MGGKEREERKIEKNRVKSEAAGRLPYGKIQEQEQSSVHVRCVRVMASSLVVVSWVKLGHT